MTYRRVTRPTIYVDKKLQNSHRAAKGSRLTVSFNTVQVDGFWCVESTVHIQMDDKMDKEVFR